MKKSSSFGESAHGPIREALEPIVPMVKSFGQQMINAHEAAEDRVRIEHPQWFIEYPQGKKIDSDRKAKMASRAKKRHYAIQAAVKEILGISPQKMLANTANEMKVVLGTATKDTEVRYLEDALDGPDATDEMRVILGIATVNAEVEYLEDVLGRTGDTPDTTLQ